jgi:uncharacterized protein YbcI
MMSENDLTAARRSISSGVVGVHREQFGRGSNSVRTIIQGDYVACFLEDVFTQAEHTLIGGGHFEQVQTSRYLFQQTLREDFIKVVEDAIGRKVRAFFSQVHTNPDMAIEAFVLEPASG